MAHATFAQDDVIRSSVTLVPVTVSITDKNGRPVNVNKGDLQIFDNGHPREIRYFNQDANTPLTVGLIPDASDSQRDFFKQHAGALKQFVGQVLRPADKGFLISVGYQSPGNQIVTDVQLIRDLTDSVEDLRAGIDRLENPRSRGPQFGDPCPGKCLGTALWTGIYNAIELRMRQIEGRKALVVLSDGVDSGSLHPLEQAIDVAQRTNTPVYTIQTAKAKRDMAKENAQGRNDLLKLSNDTGGQAFSPSDRNMAKVFAQIESELRNLYVVTFVAPESERDNQFHTLEVKTPLKDVQIHARAGYIAR
jgi:VWFA-related protein